MIGLAAVLGLLSSHALSQRGLPALDSFLGRYEGSLSERRSQPVRVEFSRVLSGRFVQIDCFVDLGGGQLSARLLVTEERGKLRAWFMDSTPSVTPLYELLPSWIQISDRAITLSSGVDLDPVNRCSMRRTGDALLLTVSSKKGQEWVTAYDLTLRKVPAK